MWSVQRIQKQSLYYKWIIAENIPYDNGNFSGLESVSNSAV